MTSTGIEAPPAGGLGARIVAGFPPALALRLAMAVAMLSVLAEHLMEAPSNLALERYGLLAGTGLMGVAAALALSERWSRVGVGLYAVAVGAYAASTWAGYHNHGWLSLWTVPVAVAFGTRWWESELYRTYLRATLGLVMLAAFAQKLIAGTWLDGSYVTFLSLHGDTTERMFQGLCGPEAAQGSCLAHRAIGIFIVLWQLVVGLLLIAGVRSLLFLFVEVAFLLGAGLFADEMNFQVLNVALLAIGFGYGMQPWLLAVCVALLALDVYGLSALADHVL